MVLKFWTSDLISPYFVEMLYNISKKFLQALHRHCILSEASLSGWPCVTVARELK